MKRLMVLFLSLALVASVAIPMNAEASTGEPVDTFFIIPHPDDELLTMGASIMNHVYNGNNRVHLVLLTGGEHSGVYNRLTTNEEYTSALSIDFNRELFKQSKMNVFKRSAYIMGVQPENVHIYDLGDGDVQINEVETIVADLKADYPNSRWKAFSYHDNHPDHANSGQALQDMMNDGDLTDVRFYIKNSLIHSGWWSENVGITPRADGYNPSWHPYIVAGAQVYTDWYPEKGYYSAGTLSVPNSFEQLLADPTSYYHMPNK